MQRNLVTFKKSYLEFVDEIKKKKKKKKIIQRNQWIVHRHQVIYSNVINFHFSNSSSSSTQTEAENVVCRPGRLCIKDQVTRLANQEASFPQLPEGCKARSDENILVPREPRCVRRQQLAHTPRVTSGTFLQTPALVKPLKGHTFFITDADSALRKG